MNPFSQLIAPLATRLPSTGHVTIVKQGVRLDDSGRGQKSRMKELSEAIALTESDVRDQEELVQCLSDERRKIWYRNRYAQKKLSDPQYMVERRNRGRDARENDPGYRARIKRWEAENVDRMREYKAAWARQRRSQETPEEREARRAMQREKERAYYAATKERRSAYDKQRRQLKKQTSDVSAGAKSKRGVTHEYSQLP